MARYLPIFLLISLLFGCSKRNPTDQKLQKELAGRRVTLPNGWSVSAAGQAVKLGDLPLNMALSSNQKWAAVTLNGYGKEGVKLVDVQTHTVTDSILLKRAWVGLAFGAGDSLLYASGGNQDNIYVIAHRGGSWTKKDSIKLGEPWPQDRISPAGLDVDSGRHRLYTVTKEDNSLYVVNLKTKKVEKRVQLKAAGYSCLLSKDKNMLYITLWGGKEVAVYDVAAGKITHHIKVEGHPNDMALTPDGQFLFVANANANSVSVIDTRQSAVIETLNAALYPHAPTGSTTNSVALSGDGKTLYAANADNNCLAVFDVSEPGHSRSLGFIPTGWYPTSVKVAGDRLLVANGKGDHSEANPNGPNPTTRRTPQTQYIGGLFIGTLSFINKPDEQDMATYSKAVYTNTPYNPADSSDTQNAVAKTIFSEPGHSSPIKHVFYIIKENRTYDQMLGDMPEGNGDAALTLFGEKVTPNHHKLARQFVLLDNFYVDAEVSADGHNWSTAAYATDYVEKTWPTNYSGRGGTYDYEGGRKIAYPDKGFIWNYCKRRGISYRSYGEFADLGGAHLDVLKGHIDKDYPGFDLSKKDVHREKLWEQDFDSLLARNEVPQFQTIRLPGDHTSGANTGRRTPQAYVADNDLALGRLIDHLSHSSIWKQSVVFVVEDDAQDGPDHVDAHRSVCLVAGGFVKRHKVVHTMYSTSSVLGTMERILGLPPMSQYDAAATPMTAVFNSTPDTSGYKAVANKIDLNTKNIAVNNLSRQSEKFNLAQADAAPDLAFDEVIWKTVRGPNSVMPAPRHSAFLHIPEKGEKDDDD